MPTYRKGEDQFELKHKAFIQPQEFDYPETVRSLLNNPTAKIENLNKEWRVTEDNDALPDLTYTDPETGEDVTEHESNSYIQGKEYPVSGSDIFKLKRGL